MPGTPPSSPETMNAIRATTPVPPATQAHQDTGRETWWNKNAPHAEIKATTKQTARQKEEDSSSATDVGKPHTAMSPALYSAVPVHQGTPMNTIHTHHHVHRTTTLYP